MQTPFLNRASDNLRSTNTPFTWTLLGLSVLTFLLSMSAGLAQLMAQNGFFIAPMSLMQPWRILTYPILNLFPNILGLLFGGLMLWWFGGSLERSWGTRTFAIFWVLVSLVTVLSFSLGASIIGQSVPVASWLPLGAMVLAWCMLNPEQSILLYGIIPILAKWIALGEVLIIFFVHMSIHPLLGLFALGGCAFAFWWARSRRWESSAYTAAYAAPPRYDSFTRGPKPKAQARRASPLNNPLNNPRSKISTPPDDRKTWRDYNPIEMIAKRRRRKQFERLMKDD